MQKGRIGGVGEAGSREADPMPVAGRAKVGIHLTSRPGDKQLLVEHLMAGRRDLMAKDCWEQLVPNPSNSSHAIRDRGEP